MNGTQTLSSPVSPGAGSLATSNAAQQRREKKDPAQRFARITWRDVYQGGNQNEQEPGIESGQQTGMQSGQKPGRYWLIPSIHGEYRRLQSIHHTIDQQLQWGDKVIYLGNFMGVGDDVRRTIDEILRFRAHSLTRKGVYIDDFIFLRGRQEEMWEKLQQVQFAGNPVEIVTWMLQNGLEATLNCYGSNETEAMTFARQGVVELTNWTNRLRASIKAVPGHLQLLATLKRAAYDGDGTLLFVNAGVDPTYSLTGQTDAFWWNQTSLPSLREPYHNFRRIFSGSTEKRAGIEVFPFATTLDGGCGYGGSLICACINRDGEFEEVYQA